MIIIEELTGMDIGRKVIYHQEHYKPEIGHLLSWNSRMVFIRFKSPAGIACDPEDVTFAKENE